MLLAAPIELLRLNQTMSSENSVSFFRPRTVFAETGDAPLPAGATSVPFFKSQCFLGDSEIVDIDRLAKAEKAPTAVRISSPSIILGDSADLAPHIGGSTKRSQDSRV